MHDISSSLPEQVERFFELHNFEMDAPEYSQVKVNEEDEMIEEKK